MLGGHERKYDDVIVFLFMTTKPETMKSPFPGMDPYLEACWRDVHNLRLANELLYEKGVRT